MMALNAASCLALSELSRRQGTARRSRAPLRCLVLELLAQYVRCLSTYPDARDATHR